MPIKNLAPLDEMQAPYETDPPRTDAVSIPAIIARASRDPMVDVEKLDRLLQMHERMQTREAERLFYEKLAAAQAEMTPIRVDSENSDTKSKYASYVAVDRAIRPIYARHGFALTFTTDESPAADMIVMVCDVAHIGGFTKRYRLPLPADGKGAKGGSVMTRTHATVSATTYGQRALAKMIFNLAIDPDDDGNAAGQQAPQTGYITPAQVDELLALADELGVDKAAFCRLGRVNSFAEIPANQYAAAKNMLLRKKKAPK